MIGLGSARAMAYGALLFPVFAMLLAYLPSLVVTLALRRRTTLLRYALWQGLLGIWSGVLFTAWAVYILVDGGGQTDAAVLSVIGLLWMASGIGVLRGRGWAWVPLTVVSLNPIWWVVTPIWWLRRYRARRAALKTSAFSAEPSP